MFTAYIIVPEEGERIFHIVPPRLCPALYGVIVKPWHFPKSLFSTKRKKTELEYLVDEWAESIEAY